MSCFYTLPSLADITDKRSLDHDLSPGFLVEFQKDEEFSLSFSESHSPVTYFPSVPGHNHFKLETQKPSIPSDSKKISLNSKSLVSDSRKISNCNETNFDDYYGVSLSDEEYCKDKRLSEIIKARKDSKSCLPSTVSEHEIANTELQNLSVSIEKSAHMDKKSLDYSMLSSENRMPPRAGSYSEIKKLSLYATPPSLDGSISSDQMGQTSIPLTPSFETSSDTHSDDWNRGVQLQPSAMATLRAISSPQDVYDEFSEKLADSIPRNSLTLKIQQQYPQNVTSFQLDSSFVSSSIKQNIENQIIRLEIPSPRRFFSTALSPGTRHTWHFDPPSSTTAENFYRTPSAPTSVQNENEATKDAILDNFTSLNQVDMQESEMKVNSPPILSAFNKIKNSGLESSNDFSDLSKKKDDCTVTNIDRTSFWVASQQSITPKISSDIQDRSEEVTSDDLMIDIKNQAQSPVAKFDCSCENSNEQRRSVNSSQGIELVEFVYYRTFKRLIAQSSNQDTFIHRVPRYEALQSQRVSFPVMHRAQLLGDYQLSNSPTSAGYQLMSQIEKGVEISPTDLEKLKRDLESEVLEQILSAIWSFMALKFLKGGSLLSTPIKEYLSLTRSKVDGSSLNRTRILDLGGLGVCEWAWHFAIEYPETQVYTITPRLLHQPQTSQLRGPYNHRNVLVDRLVKLPFRDEQFDLISARELYTILKLRSESGIDEWEACLKECFRILKPGGYLEFDIMDSDIVNAGPLGLAKNSEFSTCLKSLGYDTHPTQQWTTRLNPIGFVDLQRALLFLPMGGWTSKSYLRAESIESKMDDVNNSSGSTIDVANISGLVGLWAWERWLLRCRLEKGKDLNDVFEGIQAIISEGNKCGAGWRFLTGRAKKPFCSP